jgi:hypothetical protein
VVHNGMNEYSEHDIVDAINVADLPNVVKHRKLISPPYAAPGVDLRWINSQTGFSLKWGMGRPPEELLQG